MSEPDPVAPDEVEPPGSFEPVRDLGPRRRRLYAAIVVAMFGVDALVAATITIGCATGPCDVSETTWVAIATIGLGSIVLIALALGGTRRASAAAGSAGDSGRPARIDPAATSPEPVARLTAFLEALDRLDTDELRLLAVRPLDAEGHGAARTRARAAAARHLERAMLVDEATAAIRAWLERVFGTRSFDPTLVALAWRHEPLRLDDRDRLRETLDDAALAVVAADLIDEATCDELLGPCARLVDGRSGAWMATGRPSAVP
jgi:hypothetical protein